MVLDTSSAQCHITRQRTTQEACAAAVSGSVPARRNRRGKCRWGFGHEITGKDDSRGLGGNTYVNASAAYDLPGLQVNVRPAAYTFNLPLRSRLGLRVDILGGMRSEE